MKNQPFHLKNHLFAMLEELGDTDKTAEETELTIKKAKAMTGVTSQIVNLYKVQVAAEQLDFKKTVFAHKTGNEDLLPLGDKNKRLPLFGKPK